MNFHCGSCAFYAPDSEAPEHGTCRYSPPLTHLVTMIGPDGEPGVSVVTEWPQVDKSHWCGKYRLRDQIVTKEVR